MTEHLKKDLQQKIQEIVKIKEEEAVVEEETTNIEEKISDKEWYDNSLYESLRKKWAT